MLTLLLKFSRLSIAAKRLADPKLLPTPIVDSKDLIFPLKARFNSKFSGSSILTGIAGPAIITISRLIVFSFRLGKLKYAFAASGKPVILKSVFK
jgi:hypothetical protein